MVTAPRWLALAVALLGACEEPYSNEDLIFLRSLPDRQLVSVGVPAREPAPEPELARFYVQARNISTQLNAGLFSVLALVETISAQPPTYRQQSLRGWGPLPDANSGAVYALYISRTATAGMRVPTATTTVIPVEERYDFVMYGQAGQQGPSAPVFGGSFVPLGAHGLGTLYVDFEAMRAVNPATEERGAYWAGYDTRTPGALELALAAAAPPDPSGQPTGISAYYRFKKSAQGEVDFAFANRVDVHAPAGTPPISHLETVAIIARWQSDQRGRADVVISGGEVPAPVTASECWDRAFRAVYFTATIPELGAPIGAVEDCAEELRMPLFPR
jgi:hypothetical protein